MFSARTYFRLIELHNVAVWPLHLLAAALGVAVVMLARRGDERSGRIAAMLLGACWLWVAWAFHIERYATINSAAPYFAAGFVLQGLLLLVAGKLQSPPSRPGLGLLMVALLGYPLLALASGRPWQQAEMFGIAPDATAAVTLALLALSRRAHWTLWPVPLLWSAVSGATLWTMGVALFWVVPLIAVLALLLTLRRPPPSAQAR
ncbi:DUF6064 family protein [Massilia sp. R798]|uniref:DUF6064 family protein n=2 Tax=Massilia soli TaxID=2792854 RepID=A0ABS7STE3_9BURK|nr:DUF6064 family protein [Massilia soli]MBZ2209211.1 DUF6064 family protein [Massilia soli]